MGIYDCFSVSPFVSPYLVFFTPPFFSFSLSLSLSLSFSFFLPCFFFFLRFCLSNPFSDLCFLILSCVFVQHQSFTFKNGQNGQLQKHHFLVKLIVATKFIFCILCFAKCKKIIALVWPNFGQNYVHVQKPL